MASDRDSERDRTADTAGDALSRIAEVLSDDTPIDWDRAAADHPELSQEIASLRLFERIRDAHRSASPPPVGAPSAPAMERAGPERSVLFTWGHLRVIAKIGEGSYGEVWRAHDPELRRDVALKLLRRDPPGGNLDERAFLEEARRMAAVRHPNVTVIHGAAVHDGRTGFWSDLIDGKTLEDLLGERGTLSAAEAAVAGIEICGALAAVHATGLVHGDVKTRNVMRDSRGRIVLVDFGAAREPRTGGPSRGRVFGSPLTMAPELLDGAPVTPSTDLYALGVLIYRLASGRYPVPADDIAELEAKHRRGERVPLRDVRPDLPADFVALIDRSLSKDPAERFHSAGEMEAALRACISPHDPARAPGGHRPRRWIPTTLALLGIGLGMAVALVVMDRHRTRSPDEARVPAPAAERSRAPASPASPPAVTLALVTGEATLFRSRGGSKEALSPGGLVRPGDALFLELRVSQPAHVYVFNEDAAGNVVPVFPLEGLELQNPLDANVWHRLPGSRAGVAQDWRMSGGPGREGFLVVASREPLAGLSEKLEAAGADDRAASPPTPKTEETRGISGVVPVNPAGQGEPESRLSKLTRALLDEASDPGGLWVREFVLFNAGR